MAKKVRMFPYRHMARQLYKECNKLKMEKEKENSYNEGIWMGGVCGVLGTIFLTISVIGR